jgi:hypothetical protein
LMKVQLDVTEVFRIGYSEDMEHAFLLDDKGKVLETERVADDDFSIAPAIKRMLDRWEEKP